MKRVFLNGFGKLGKIDNNKIFDIQPPTIEELLGTKIKTTNKKKNNGK